jgi:signal transduction histidine kinase
MELPLNLRVWTDAVLPLLDARSAPVYLALGGAIGAMMAVLAHLAWRESGLEAWRRLRFVGVVLAPALIGRALGRGVLIEPHAILAAAFSLLDLALLAMAAGAVTALLKQAGRRHEQRGLGLLLMLGVFLGLLGGDLEQPLLARNLPAAACHLLFYSVLAGVMLREFVITLRNQREIAQERGRVLVAEIDVLRSEHAEAVSERQAALAKSAQGIELARDAGRRARLLEHLLAGAVDLQARRGQRDLHEYTVELVRVLFGFESAVLYQWSSSLDAFEAQASAPGDNVEERRRGTVHLDRSQYDQLVHPRFRISDSYLVPPHSLLRGVNAPADEAAWPDGQRLIVPLTDPAGTVHGFLDLSRPETGHAPDLLRIRYLELLARQVAAILEVLEVRERLAGCRADLVLATERLQALGDLRNNFVANVSHELRTPLTSIIGYAEVLRERGEEMSTEMRREFVDVIHQQGLRFKEIINDLLDLDRMEEGDAKLERIECDLAALVRRLAEDWRQRAAAAGQELIVETSNVNVPVEADPVLCQQLLGHLVDNAMKFTPESGRIHVRLSEQGTAVRLEVEDSGIGIPEDKLHTIFEQFYQVDGSSTREVGGQGVGLAICQDIVSWHDGRIWAENVRDGGTRLTVLLPRRPHVVMPEPPAPIHPVFHEPRLFLQRVVHWIGENLGVQTTVLLAVNRAGGCLNVLGATGLPAGQLQDLHLAAGVGLAGRVWRDGCTRFEKPEPGDVLLTGDSPVLCVPLASEDDIRGVVVVRDRLDGRPLTDDDRVLLEAMSPRLVHLLARYDGHDEMVRDFAAIQSALRVTTRVGTLPHADVAGVCQEICLATARRLGLPESDLRHLAFALQYYDVGLGSVPPHLLNKTEMLTDAERALLERHVKVGLVTLAPLQPPPKVRQIILHHHENYDGSGYPKGLAGEAIPLGSRLVALSDSLRALLQRRPWRPAVPLADALAEIQALAGTRYCPRLAAVFLSEAEKRRTLIEELRQRADDGEDLKRPAPLHPVQLVRS